MMNELVAQLTLLALALNAQTKSADARIHYDLLSGALWWSDEPPATSEFDTSCLRYLFRYRTSVITNAPESGYLPLWLAAKNLFPNWPGFAHERCQPDEQLAALYRRSNVRGLLSLDLMDIICRLEKEFNGMVPSKSIDRHVDRNEPPDITVGVIYHLTCRCLRLARREIPADAWYRVRGQVAESLGVRPEVVTKESWLVRDLRPDYLGTT